MRLSGPSRNGQDDFGNTPLHSAANDWVDHWKTVQILVDAGADAILLNDP